MLICILVFANAKSRFSHEVAHMCINVRKFFYKIAQCNYKIDFIIHVYVPS